MIFAIPVVVCPAIFWLIYNVFFFFSGYTYARAIDTKKDFIGTDAMGHAFAYQVISLTGKGLLAGLGCGILVSLLFRLKRKDSYSSPIVSA